MRAKDEQKRSSSGRPEHPPLSDKQPNYEFAFFFPRRVGTPTQRLRMRQVRKKIEDSLLKTKLGSCFKNLMQRKKTRKSILLKMQKPPLAAASASPRDALPQTAHTTVQTPSRKPNPRSSLARLTWAFHFPGSSDLNWAIKNRH